MIINQIKITRATIDDMLDLFELANDPEVRKNSFNQEKIDLETHKKWFNNRVDNDDFLLLVARVENNFFGHAIFEKNLQDEFIISIYINQIFRGRGLGKNFLKILLKEIFLFKRYKKIIAKIKFQNIASLKIFLDNDFKIINYEKENNFFVLSYE